jgi:hypothetical protein
MSEQEAVQHRVLAVARKIVRSASAVISTVLFDQSCLSPYQLSRHACPVDHASVVVASPPLTGIVRAYCSTLGKGKSVAQNGRAMSHLGQSRPVRASNGSVHAHHALKADVESTDLCRLMVPRCTLYKLPKGSLVWMQSNGADLLQPTPLSRPKSSRAILQQDQAVSAGRDAL